MFGEETSNDKSGVLHPARPVSRKTAEPILYLAERMAQSDREAVRRETRIIEMMAKAVGIPAFRDEASYRSLTEAKALAAINSDLAKQATLVLLTLILKADVDRKDEEHSYFRRVREALDAPPVTVPVSMEAHTKLALEYFADSRR